ncbi:ergothioneine biosynthesis protein EgtB [Flagellimonas sp. DF-77]|uniref:ergothioneine biosynthesis protein EgtB n=1 Tax=Flagellimonas algarum TaxID=3230298 RepID=UPI003390F918
MLQNKSLPDFFTTTRNHTEAICEPLETEDYVVQPIVDVSPPKWHLGHTTWFFEAFILIPHAKGYREFDPDFSFVFNSYYETMGKRVVRADRGNMSRPSVKQVYAYRAYVNEAIGELFESTASAQLHALLEIGIHHEKQHQELLLADIKYILGNNPLLPRYSEAFDDHPVESHEREWLSIAEGLYPIGHASDSFCFDNELGTHRVFLNAFEIANKLTTNGEYLEFITAGGYSRFDLWHSAGWDWVNQHQIAQPLYWHQVDGVWMHYTAKGLLPLDLEAPLTHISYFEAFAFAQWKGCRLPTEFEWETAQAYFPWGKRWEWTESAYLPYPNYKKAEGALGEYNGKFMVNQKVLRGGSVATPSQHTRHTYRNFFQPEHRWQFTGIRLVR